MIPQPHPARISPLGESRSPDLARALAAGGIGAFEWDLVHGELRCDPLSARILGLTADHGGAGFEGPADAFFDRVHPADLPVLQAEAAEALDRGGSYHSAYRVRHADGSVHTVHERGSVELAADGTPVLVSGVMVDRGRAAERDSCAAERTGFGGEARNAFLLTLTRALSRAITVHDLATVLNGLVRPTLAADAVLLHVLDEAGQGEEHSSTYYQGERTTCEGDQRLRETAHEAMHRALRDERPLFLSEVSDGQEDRAWAVLPLIVSGRPVGACLIAFRGPREFSGSERALCTALTGIIAQSAERARLHDLEHRHAMDLQRMMLPRQIAAVPGLETAARYLPGTAGLEVGGDWYDVLSLPGGRIGLVVGDVQGHSAEASATMGVLRVGLRAYAREGLPPDQVLSRTSGLLADLDSELFATCCYLELDPAGGLLRGVRAGHPLPVRLAPDGSVTELALPGGPPLGVEPRAGYEVRETRLGCGESLLLYTDGLVERRDEDLDLSVARLLDRIRGWSGPWIPGGRAPGAADAPGLEELADRLIAPHRDAVRRYPDDIALLLVRRLQRAA
ncbi:SpoIIE family protein phosphatase [Phaeacidiphilus oryzae]|uniref:SpoIIE family protein phosphatase n=1 Tax=Phaeacidiphilus oryzae TaxID=348818 RepID=UPI00068DE455|nr:SpoIIE family protein phosphatase [Phaeacidiphilus oryzae]